MRSDVLDDALEEISRVAKERRESTRQAEVDAANAARIDPENAARAAENLALAHDEDSLAASGAAQPMTPANDAQATPMPSVAPPTTSRPMDDNG